MTPILLKVAGLVWVAINTIAWTATLLQFPTPSPTLFTSSDLLLGSMIVGSYLVIDRRLNRMEKDIAYLRGEKAQSNRDEKQSPS